MLDHGDHVTWETEQMLNESDERSGGTVIEKVKISELLLETCRKNKTAFFSYIMQI